VGVEECWAELDGEGFDPDSDDYGFDIELHVEAERERREERRMGPKWDREAEDERLIRLGWRPNVIHPADASHRLAAVRGTQVKVRCKCDKVLGSFIVGDFGREHSYRRVLLPVDPRRDGYFDRLGTKGTEDMRMFRWTVQCPMRRCGARHVVNLDKFTLAFLLIAERKVAEREITLPLSIPRRFYANPSAAA
jgi:hypothetical protein